MRSFPPLHILVEMDQKFMKGGRNETAEIRIFAGEVYGAFRCSGAQDRGRASGLDGGGYPRGLQERRDKGR